MSVSQTHRNLLFGKFFSKLIYTFQYLLITWILTNKLRIKRMYFPYTIKYIHILCLILKLKHFYWNIINLKALRNFWIIYFIKYLYCVSEYLNIYLCLYIYEFGDEIRTSVCHIYIFNYSFCFIFHNLALILNINLLSKILVKVLKNHTLWRAEEIAWR